MGVTIVLGGTARPAAGQPQSECRFAVLPAACMVYVCLLLVAMLLNDTSNLWCACHAVCSSAAGGNAIV